MTQPAGLRTRKKAQTRRRIAEVAADLFAAKGFDAVSMLEVARAAEVSEQTVYNYFSAKQDLVLDRAQQIRELYDSAVRERDPGSSPAAAMAHLISADVDRYLHGNLDHARGEFLAQSVHSPVLRRFTLEERERQTRVIADAIAATTPDLPDVVVYAHAAAIIAAVQIVHDQIGTSVLERADQPSAATHIAETARIAFASLDHTFVDLATHTSHHLTRSRPRRIRPAQTHIAKE